MISSFAINALAGELKYLENSSCDKIDQVGKETFKFTFVEHRKKHDILAEIGKRINETRFKIETPREKSMLSIIFRKYLAGKKLIEIRQHNFDRVLVLKFLENYLIFEFFAKGNMVLTDADFKILQTFRAEEWKDRVVKKGEKYLFPASENIKNFTLSQFSKIFDKQDIVRSLALNLKIGGEYAEKICELAEVDKKKENPSPADIGKMFDAFHKILNEKKQVFEVEFKKSYETISDALDDKFGIEQKTSDAKSEQFARRLEKQKEAIKRFEKEAEEAKQAGDLIYANFEKIQNASEQWKKDKSKLTEAAEKGKNIEIELD